MPKKFFTDKDIEELHHRGIQSLPVNDDVVLTDLAYEKAKRLGIQLLFEYADNPPAAPMRPYLSERQAPRPTPTVTPGSPTAATQPNPTPPNQADIEKRIRSAVIARLGNQVDAKLLDNIIHRVVKGVGLK